MGNQVNGFARLAQQAKADKLRFDGL